jgi:hemoglobin/transferrin/lactoferrin receptor protein
MKASMIWSVVAVGFLSCDLMGETNGIGKPAADIVVTGVRVGKEMQSVPSIVYRMDADRKSSEEGLRSMPDMMKGIPSAMVQKTSYGQGSPYLRGLTGFRNLLLVDGIRLNNSVFRDGPNQYWNTVDPLSVGSTELAMGPASVLYGSDAIGGTLNAMPVTPPAYAGSPVWQRRLFYRGATAEDSHVGRVQVGGSPTAQFGFVGGVSIKDFGDLKGGRDVGTQKHTGYTEQDFDFRADWRGEDESVITLGHQTVDQDDAWRTHRTIYGIDWEGLKAGDDKAHSYDQQRDLTYLKGRHENLNGIVDGMEWTMSRQAQGEDLYRVLKDDQRVRQGFDVTTVGASLQLESDWPAGKWVYGAEYYHDRVDSYSRKYAADDSLQKTEIQGPVADNAIYDSVGIFAEDTITLMEGGLEVVPGVRYAYSRVDADRVKDALTGKPVTVEDEWGAVVGSLRVLYPLTADRRHVAFAGVAQGYRAPNLSDLTRLDSARSNEIETPSPDLDPERYAEYEAGVKSRFKRFTAQACYYYTKIDGMIIRTPTGRVIEGSNEVTKKNSGDGFIQGIELSTKYVFTSNWSAWLSGSLMDGEVDTYPTSSAVIKRDPISRLMPPTVEAGLRWQRTDGRYWVELVGDAASKADTLSADDKRDTQRIPPGGTPGYAVCHVRTGTKVGNGVDLSLSVENVLDEDYRIHGSGVNEPGRNLILTASCEF